MEPTKTEIYANMVSTAGGFYDITVDFSTSDPPSTPNRPPEIVQQVRIRMSWQHAKSVMVLLADAIMQYEKQTTDMPLPPELQAKWEKLLKASGVAVGKP